MFYFRFSISVLKEDMQVKYRIKVNDDRILGPLDKDEVAELYIKGHLEGEEECQIYPSGKWEPLSQYTEIVKAISLRISTKQDENFEKKLHQLQKFKRIVDDPERRNFDYKNTTNIDLDQLSEETSDSINVDSVENDENGPIQHGGLRIRPADISQSMAKKPEMNYSGNGRKSLFQKIDKTVIVSRKNLEQKENLDKTLIIPRKSIDSLGDNSKVINPNSQEESEIKELPIVSSKDATQMFDIAHFKGDLAREVIQAEEDFKQKIEKEQNEKNFEKNQELKDKLRNKTSSEEIESEQEKPKKRKMKLAVMLTFIIIFVELLWDDTSTQSKMNPIYAQMHFPVMAEYSNTQKSLEEYEKGLKLYAQDNYMSKVKAANHFLLSLVHKFENNEAFSYLLMVYGELLPDMKDKTRAINIFYQMLQLNQSLVYKDFKAAIGASLFYSSFGKFSKATKILDNYLIVEEKLHLKLLSVYLSLLLENNELEKAKKVFDLIKDVQNKLPETFLALASYFRYSQDAESAKTTIEEGVTKYMKSVPLLFEYANILLSQGDVKKYADVLKIIEELGAENSPVYTAKYYEHMGILASINGTVEIATQMFRLSLAIHESPRLRSRLSELELGGTRATEMLIKESKISQLISESKDYKRKYNWQVAILKAVEASDLMPSSVEARLNLAKLQIERGYYSVASDILEKLHEKNITNDEVTYHLIINYIKSFRFTEAKNVFSRMMNSEFVNSYYYPSARAQYFKAIEEFVLAAKWFKMAMNANPLDDFLYYELADLFFHYKQNTKAMNYLVKAMELDPDNRDYKIMFSNILFESKGVDDAIGYLRSELSKSPNNPVYMGQIATFYHRSGQLKEFQRSYDQIDKLFEKDERFYRFLVEVSELDDKKDDALEYIDKLIIISPGDSDLYLKKGLVLLDMGKVSLAERVLLELSERVPKYPKLNYYLANINIKLGTYEKALDYAKMERELDKESYYGHYIFGYVNFLMENYPDAIKSLEKAVGLKPLGIEALKTLGHVKVKQNYFDQAIQLFNRAKEIDPNDHEIYRSLGEIYEKTGQRAMAHESYKTYLDLNINADDRNLILSKLQELK